MHPNVSGIWVDDYLQMLNLTARPPSLQFLHRLTQAQIATFPFENISKIACQPHRDKTAIPPVKVQDMVQDFLSGYRRFGFGGTCFTLNWMFKSLLLEIGFDCYIVMLSHQHMGIIVQIPEFGGKKFYVDCGAAAPLSEPINLESGENSGVCFGNERVVIRHRIAESVYRFERYRNRVRIGEPWYFDTKQPQTLQDFLPLIQSSYEPNRTFMSLIYCHKFGHDLSYYLSLKNDCFQICYRDGRIYNHYLHSAEEIRDTAHQIFHIEPAYIELALSKIQQSGACIFTHTVANL
jgi:N-hydroxyarylamine O-acetyltransferase